MYITGLPAADLNLTTTQSNSTLDRDAFFQLLATQLQYQDPSNLQDTGEFINQMTSFAILEQLTQIGTNLSNLFDAEKQFQTIQMLGKNVLITDGEGNSVEGTVQSLRFSSGGPLVKVNNTEYYLSQIEEIKIDENQD